VLSIGTKLGDLNDIERRNGRVVCVISPNTVALGSHYVKVVEDTPILSARNLVFSGLSLMAIFAGNHPSARALR